ncbi:MAG TPA: hypothetical protein VGA50_11860 [Kiloniellales bacterium]
MNVPAFAGLSQAERNRDALAAEHLMADLGQRTAAGGAIVIGAQAVRMVLRLATAAAMARLLARKSTGFRREIVDAEYLASVSDKGGDAAASAEGKPST